jgi:hypothetical protein
MSSSPTKWCPPLPERLSRISHFTCGVVSVSWLLLGASACGSSGTEALSTTTAPLIDGVPGGPAQIGNLQWNSTDGTRDLSCSGTLVAPDLVLSARHCVYDDQNPGHELSESGTWGFTLSTSNDETTWTDLKDIKETLVPELVPTTNSVNWVAPFGTPDLALFRLATPVTTVTPLAVSLDAVSLEKPTFVASGYGFASHNGTDALGKNFGTTTLLALSGQPAHLQYPTLAAFEQAVSDALAFPEDQFNDVDLMRIQQWYDLPLAEGYEAKFGALQSDASPCHGDSGSGLLQQGSDGQYRVYGVDQSTIDLNPDNDTRLCDFGPFYALFNNAAARDFLSKNGLGQGGAGSGGASSATGGAGSSSSLGSAGTGNAGGPSNAAGSGMIASGGSTAAVDDARARAAKQAVPSCSFTVSQPRGAGFELCAVLVGLGGVLRRRRRVRDLESTFAAARRIA